jgi:GTP:adenosylcobinamide-phosphate guanylyltransferase|tara:strand:- start:562 stop:777 length:216 start_codon:yes stop_codon:yes gene_type:complete
MSKQSITIDGVEHLIDDLSDEQKAIVVSINEADREVERCKHLIAICQTARQAYINDLGSQLNSGEVGEEES